MLLTSGALFSAEITGYAVVCIAMHMRKINQVRSGGFSGGLLPVLPVSRQKRAEGLSGGADNGCYGKCWIARTISPAMLHIIANGFTSKMPNVVADNPRTMILARSPPTMRDKKV